MNQATKTIVATIGVILAVAGLAHGIPEVLRGNAPTEGLIIQAIGPEDASGVNRWLEALERIGRAGVFVIPCLYRIRVQDAMAVVSLVAMTLALVCYYLGWLRYMQRGRRYALLFAPMWGIPLPMAVMPVITFGAAAALLRSWPLAAAMVVFAIGHLAVSEHERRRIASLAC